MSIVLAPRENSSIGHITMDAQDGIEQALENIILNKQERMK
jgi:hypothetical protein